MKSLKFTRTDIGFKELKGECSLLVEVSNCGNHCKGCHSPHLQRDIGKEMTELYSVIDKYRYHLTAICFLGHGDETQHEQFIALLRILKKRYSKLNLGLYSGSDKIELAFMLELDYYKVGSYKHELGGLESPTTNQVMYNMTGDKTTVDLFY